MADEEQHQQRHQQQHHHHHRRHPAEVEMESVVIGKSGYHDDDDAAPMELTEEYDAMFNFKPDTGAVSIDGVRAICIFVMFFKSFTQRMTKLSNPVTNAFGYDWISSAFYFAQGARTAFNVSKLNKDLKTMSPEDAKLTRAENYVRTLFSNFMVFVWASILVITEVSHERFSMWDVLHTVIIFDTCAYPLARFVPLWMTLPFIPIILLISPYIFDVLDGTTHYDQYGWINKDFSVSHLLGSLFFYGPTPVFPNFAVGLWGMFMTSRCLVEPVASDRKRGFYAFVGIVMILVAIELQQVYFARGPFDLWVAKYFFTKFTALPFSFSWTLLQMGASTVSFTTLAIVFDPLPYEKKERIERHVKHMKTYMYDVAEIALYYTKIFFYRVSRWTMSFYIWYGFVIWVPLRIIGAVKYDDDLWYVDRPELVWDTKEEVADVILVIAGIFEFIIFYIVYYFWEIYGHQGRFTVEYTVGKAGEFGWWIFKRFFEKDNEDKEEEQISNIF